MAKFPGDSKFAPGFAGAAGSNSWFILQCQCRVHCDSGNSTSPHKIPFPGSSLGSRQDPWALPFAPRVVFEASSLGRETGNAEMMFFLGNGQRETWSFPGVCESSSQTLNWISPDWIIRIWTELFSLLPCEGGRILQQIYKKSVVISLSRCSAGLGSGGPSRIYFLFFFYSQRADPVRSSSLQSTAPSLL